MKPRTPSLLASLVCAAALVGALPARANPPEPTLTAALQDKTSVGQARLKVWGFDVYDATLFARSGFDPARYGEQRFALELAYLRDFKGADIAERSIDEMKDLATIEPAQATRWTQAMSSLFPDVKRGDRITGVHVPGSGARFYLNGKLLGEVADDAFSRLFFGIWLSPKTSQPRMRETLIQGIGGTTR